MIWGCNINTRKVKEILKSKSAIEGAGVHLKRAFGFDEVPRFDPFLLLDDFRNDNSEFYIKGFPWHPHRGIETVTYVLDGNVEHSDSIGNKDIIGSGDVQWMTAGSGILHQEMPIGDRNGRLAGFQLWVNLPASDKMTPPRYCDIKSNQIPSVITTDGVNIRVICGKVNDVIGPVQDRFSEIELLDITLPAESKYIHQTEPDHTVFIYIIEGTTNLDSENSEIPNGSLVLFDKGDQIILSTKEKSSRLLYFSGKPLGEPIAWRGPIVMNTQEELSTAFQEYRSGTFINNQ